MRAIGRFTALAGALCVVPPCALAAQSPGSLAAERRRLAEVTGAHVTLPDTAARPFTWEILSPSVQIVWNSNIPYTLNDGPLWAGRGVSASISLGARATWATRIAALSATLEPDFSFSQNLAFQIMPSVDAGRSPFANPFHGPAFSADLPLRFGDRPLTRLDFGASAIAVERDGIRLALTTASDWWGPGIRNALVMSNHAAGIPRLELTTSRPRRTRIGILSAKAIAGTLTESVFFDYLPNNYRALSGLHVLLKPAFDTTLTLGLARVVYTPSTSPITGPLSHALDAFVRWERMVAPDDTTLDGRSTQRSDQITALSARWVFVDAGLEVYGEFARADLPRSLTELLTALHASGAYTLGFQWAQPRRARDYLRLQAELTYLDQTLVFPDRPPSDYYTGHGSLQGYTQRGQVVGAAIGPGGSSQWLAIDYLAPRWQAGVFTGRIRWENDALYRQFARNFYRHDVTLLAGLRGAARSRLTDLRADVTFGYRFNYLFQDGFANPGGFRTVDVRNLTVTLSASPR